MKWFAYGMIWLCTAVAVIAGIYITGSAWCLWALLLPASVKFQFGYVCEEDEEE